MTFASMFIVLHFIIKILYYARNKIKNQVILINLNNKMFYATYMLEMYKIKLRGKVMMQNAFVLQVSYRNVKLAVLSIFHCRHRGELDSLQVISQRVKSRVRYIAVHVPTNFVFISLVR